MPDITLPRSSSNNGVATPATPGSITAVAGNLLVLVIAAKGTSPTLGLPTSTGTWVQIQKAETANLAVGMYMQANNAGGAINPSSVLGGTITGYLDAIFEFTATGANCGLQGSAISQQNTAAVPNNFPTSGQTLSNELFITSVVSSSGQSFTPTNSFLGLQGLWSASVQSQSNVQGLSMDTYWASGLGQGVGQYPTTGGSYPTGTANRIISAWFNSIASQPSNQDNIDGNSGVLVGGNYQGMIGG